MKQSPGYRLRNFREKELEIPQMEFAKRIGCRQSHLSEIENDKSKMSIDLLEKLYEEFGYSPNYHLIGLGNTTINEGNIDTSLLKIQEEFVPYQTTRNIDVVDKNLKVISEENNLLRRQVERLTKELTEINTKLIKAHEKIIHLFEKEEKHEYA